MMRVIGPLPHYFAHHFLLTSSLPCNWSNKSIMSAFTSALSGGLMMAQAVYGFCAHRRMKFIPENHADSSLDEYFSYAFASLGFYFQVS